MCLLRPFTFFPQSNPRRATGTDAAPLTDCASMIPAVGSGSRPDDLRTRSRSRSWNSATRRLALTPPAPEEGVDAVPCGEVRRHRSPGDAARNRVAQPRRPAAGGSSSPAAHPFPPARRARASRRARLPTPRRSCPRGTSNACVVGPRRSRTSERNNHTTGARSWTAVSRRRKTAAPGPPVARLDSTPTSCTEDPTFMPCRQAIVRPSRQARTHDHQDRYSNR